jgi:hypothetical protein
MGFKVNMNDVSDGFEAVPAGTYIAEIRSTTAQQAGDNAKNPGSWYAKVTFAILSPEEYKGKFLFNNASLLPQALFTLKNLAVATGLQQEVNDIDAEDEEDFIEQLGELINGSKLKLTVIQKPYEGDVVNNIKRMRALDSEDEDALAMMPD